jgi:hypothetical protein
VLWVRLLPSREDENASAIEYFGTFCWSLEKDPSMITFVPTKWFHFQDLCFKSEPVRRMLLHIYRSEIQKWWGLNCDTFLWKEVELRYKIKNDTRDYVFYSERLRNQYEIFWVKFLEELFHWIDWLQEDP